MLNQVSVEEQAWNQICLVQKPLENGSRSLKEDRPLELLHLSQESPGLVAQVPGKAFCEGKCELMLEAQW
jgi:hypothetical protein